jgi:hypothetical protein
MSITAGGRSGTTVRPTIPTLDRHGRHPLGVLQDDGRSLGTLNSTGSLSVRKASEA